MDASASSELGENPLMAGDARLAWAGKGGDLDATSPDATGDTLLARQASPRSVRRGRDRSRHKVAAILVPPATCF